MLLLYYKFKAMHRFLFCLQVHWSVLYLQTRWAEQTSPYCTGRAGIFDALPAQAVVYRRNHPCGDQHSNELYVPDYLQVLGLEIREMHLTCPSMIRVYDCDRSNDAVTLRPRYSSLNQYALRIMK